MRKEKVLCGFNIYISRETDMSFKTESQSQESVRRLFITDVKIQFLILTLILKLPKHMELLIRPPDRFLTSNRKTCSFNIIQGCDRVTVLPRGLERLVRSVVEAARLERATVAQWRRRRRRGQVRAVRRRLGGVGESR